MPKRELVTHPLPPIYDRRSKVLILGTMPSPISRSQAFYYANPQNRFWRVICSVLGEEYLTDNQARQNLCLSRGIALWDVIKSCTIEGASDSSIKNAEPNDIARLLEATDIRAIFTTGKTAGRLYQKLCEKQVGLRATVLPSPSGANCAVSFDKLTASYGGILEFL